MWRAILRKEFVEVFGDSRTIFNVVVGPLLFTPLVMAGVLTLFRTQAAESRREKVVVAVVGLAKAPAIAVDLKGAESSGIEFLPASSPSEAEQDVRSRRVGVGLVIPADSDAIIARAHAAPLTVISDDGSDQSSQAADRLREYLRGKGEKIAARRLATKGLTMEAVQPFDLQDRALKGTAKSTLLLAVILPYVLAMSALMGGLMAATNTVAGEKERGTLETLLVTPVSRVNIAIGKFLTVTVVALISSSLSLIGMLWPFFVRLPAFAGIASQGLSLKPVAILAMILVQLPLALFGAGVLLALSTYSKNQKEMQTYTLPFVLMGTVGSMLSMPLKTNGPLYWALIPVTNDALVLKQALQGAIDPAFVAIACAASLAYAAGAVLLAAHLFRRESVLTRT